MYNTKQLNNSLLTQLSNVAMLFNAAAGFSGKHIAVLDAIRSGCVEADVLYVVEIAKRITSEYGNDMDCYNIAEIKSDADVISAIRLITDMQIELAL